MVKSKKIFITGGAGYLGKNLIKKWYEENEITVFSRDEAKHYFLQKEFPRVRFIVGDIRNFDLLTRSCAGHDFGVFAASLKQIEACEANYEEATQTIVLGAFNSKKAAIDNKFKSACFISTDKSVCPTTIYGMCKGLAGESFIEDNFKTDCKLNTALYGNICNSTGSVVPLIWESIKNNRQLSLYGEEMTRFILSINDAINVVDYALTGPYNNSNIIPKASSFKIKDLFEIYKEEFGLRYITTKPRNNEKIHEIMVSQEHAPRTFRSLNNKFYINKKSKPNLAAAVQFPNNEYSSRDFCLSKDDLYKYLKQYNFFQS